MARDLIHLWWCETDPDQERRRRWAKRMVRLLQQGRGFTVFLPQREESDGETLGGGVVC